MERAFEKQLSTQLEFRRKCFVTFCENLFEDIIHDVANMSLSDLKLYSSNISRYCIDFSVEFVCIK